MKIFPTVGNSSHDGSVIADNSLVHIDGFNVLCVFDADDAMNNNWIHKMYFPLNNAASITFKRIVRASRRHMLGWLVITGLFGLQEEKITIKMDLPNYNELLTTRQLWQ